MDIRQHDNAMFTQNQDDEIDLHEVMGIIAAHKIFILAVTFFVFIVASLVVINIAPKYKTTALLQIANHADAIDINGTLQGVSGLNVLLNQGGTKPSDIQSALMRSRFILQPVIDRNHLNIVILPRYFPVLGALVARNYNLTHDVGVIARPLFGLTGYAWGGESLKVSSFVVPESFIGKKFIVVAGKDNRFNLYHNGDLVLHGKVGQQVSVSATNVRYRGVMILINSMHARYGAGFTLVKKADASIIKELVSNFTIQDKGDRVATGILSLSLVGYDPVKLPKILNTILDIEVVNNLKKIALESRKSVRFLNERAPILRVELNKAEQALDRYRAKSGSLSVSQAAQLLSNRVVIIEGEVETLKLKRSQLLQTYTEQHPLVQLASTKLVSLRHDLVRLKRKLRMLPSAEKDEIALERQVKIKQHLYVSILNRIQQLQLVQLGESDNVKVLDRAAVSTKLPGYKSKVLLGSLVFGFMLAVILVFLRRLFAPAIDDPEVIERSLGITSYAVLPFSKRQEKILFGGNKRKSEEPNLLSVVGPHDIVIEGLRSLRTVLHVALKKHDNNVINLLGAGPGVGKSFIAANLAALFSDAKKKVLLLDADLRKGAIFNYLRLRQGPGLAEFLQDDEVEFDQIKQIVRPNTFDFIAAGSCVGSPTELFMSGRFEELMVQVKNDYDLVLIDTPPVLSATDGLLVAQRSDINLLVVGSGKNNLRELSYVVKRAKQSDVNITGLIFNTVRKDVAHQNYYCCEYKS